MKNKLRKITALLLTGAMCMSAGACGKSEEKTSTGSTSASSQESSDEPVTLTIWNTEVLTPGIQTNEVAKEIEKKLGIKMEIVQGDAQKFSILVAGGDLPDIIYTNPAQQNVASNNLITSGQLMPMDELIDQYGENIKKNFPDRLKYSKQFASNGEDKVFYLPVLAYQANEEHPNVSYSIENVGLMTRWDIYEAIGCPEIKTTDDYLNALKEMQEYAREKDLADGKQIYAISGWSDWGLWPWWLANTREMGYTDLANSTIFNYKTKSVEGVFASNAFWESLEFYNKAYNMGILDPEAFTMKNDQFWEKCKNGQVMMAYASWQTEGINTFFQTNGHPEWSYQKLPYDGYDYISGIVSTTAPLGSGIEYATAITKNCKNPEKAMELIDFMNSEEGARLIYSGVEGTHWVSKDGAAQPTEEFITQSKTDPDYKLNVGVNLYNKLCGFKDIQVLTDGYPADLMKSDEQKAATITDTDKSYCEYYSKKEGGDYQYPGQVLYDMWQKEKVNTITDFYLYPTLVQSPDEETLNIIAQCEQYMNVQGVNAIMTATAEDFAACKEETLKGLESKEYSKATAKIEELYAAAEKEAEAFGMK